MLNITGSGLYFAVVLGNERNAEKKIIGKEIYFSLTDPIEQNVADFLLWTSYKVLSKMLFV